MVGLSAFFMTYPLFGVRPQVIDWIGVLLVWILWTRFEKTDSIRMLAWYIPLFLLWANLHGGFPFGLALLGLLMLFRIGEEASRMRAEKQKERAKPAHRRHNPELRQRIALFLLILIAAAGVTLINPYGYRLHADIIDMTRENSLLRTYITEWQPAPITALSLLPFFTFIALILIFIFAEPASQKNTARDAAVWVILLVLALSTMRFIPFFVFLALPLLHRRLNRNELFIPLICFATFGAFLFLTAYVQTHAAGTPKDVMYGNQTALLVPQKDTFYEMAPASALEFMRQQQPDRLFAEVDWGGSIIWALRDTPVFIDGRMPFWREGDKRIFADYITIAMTQPGWYIILPEIWTSS